MSQRPSSFLHYQSIFYLGLPIVLGQLGTIVLSFADTAMVGHYGTPDLAASSFVNSIFNLTLMLILGYSYGLTPFVATAYGQSRYADAGETLRRGLRANLSFGAALMLLVGGLYFVLPLMGQPSALLPLIRGYYLQMWVSLPFVVLFSCLRQFTDAITQTRTAMWILLGGNVLNIGLNYLLIFGHAGCPEWGLLGAGWATLLSRIVMAAALAWVVFRARGYAHFWAKGAAHPAAKQAAVPTPEAAETQLAAPLPTVAQIHQQSWPVSAQIGCETFAFTAVTVMGGWLGAVELASLQVLFTLSTLGFSIYYSFAAAMGIRVAHFLAQHDGPEALTAARSGRNLLLVNALLSSLVFIIGGERLLRLFSTDAAVVQTSISLLALLVLYQFADALQICYANALRAIQHVRPVSVIAAVSYLGIGIPLSALLAFPCGLGLKGFYLGLFSCLLSAAVGYWRCYRSRMAQLVGELSAKPSACHRP